MGRLGRRMKRKGNHKKRMPKKKRIRFINQRVKEKKANHLIIRAQ